MDLLSLWDQISRALEPWSQDSRLWLSLAALFAVLFFLSFREFSSWFFKTAGLRTQLKEINTHLSEIRRELELLKAQAPAAGHNNEALENSPLAPLAPPVPEAPKPPTFHLHH